MVLFYYFTLPPPLRLNSLLEVILRRIFFARYCQPYQKMSDHIQNGLKHTYYIGGIIKISFREYENRNFFKHVYYIYKLTSVQMKQKNTIQPHIFPNQLFASTMCMGSFNGVGGIEELDAMKLEGIWSL